MVKLKNVGHAILLTIEIVAIPTIIVWGWYSHLPAKSAEERMRSFDAVVVSFDANGGTCTDNIRVVEKGETYGETMNLYPSEDFRYFMHHSCMTVDPETHLIVAKADYSHKNTLFADYATSNVVSAVTAGSKWTYVVDVESFEGVYAAWVVGQTLPSVKSQLSFGSVGSGLKSGEKKFLTLTGQDPRGCTLLDRAYLQINPGQQLKAKWHVSLFAGTAINAANYHYVKPGETLECPLPVPTRPGYTFLGWYDGDQKIEASTKVTRKDAHTLKAKWQGH